MCSSQSYNHAQIEYLSDFAQQFITIYSYDFLKRTILLTSTQIGMRIDKREGQHIYMHKYGVEFFSAFQ